MSFHTRSHEGTPIIEARVGPVDGVIRIRFSWLRQDGDLLVSSRETQGDTILTRQTNLHKNVKDKISKGDSRGETPVLPSLLASVSWLLISSKFPQQEKSMNTQNS
jgi:hypothetical protein